MLQNQIISYIRVGVVLAVGALLTWAAQSLHIVVSPHTQDGLVTLATAVVAFAYYLIVRELERRWPSLGVLLGVPAKPDYPEITAKPKGDSGEAGVVLLVAVVICAICLLILVFHGRVHIS